MRNVAIGALATVHVLGILGAPFAAKLHVFQPGATAHQNFHVLWEACKYAAASLVCLYVVLGPLRRREPWAWNVLLLATLLLFGGVFVADAFTRGAPAIDHWAYGSFLVISLAALLVIRRLPHPTRSPQAAR